MISLASCITPLGATVHDRRLSTNPPEGEQKLGNRLQLSPLDIAQINDVYQCKKSTPSPTLSPTRPPTPTPSPTPSPTPDCCLWGTTCNRCPHGSEHVWPKTCSSSRRCRIIEPTPSPTPPPPIQAHVLAVGDLVVAKWPAYRQKDDNPWFAGEVTAIGTNAMRCSINYEDGDFSDDVKEDEVYYAPSRDSSWGKGNLRGNDLIPSGALAVTFN